MYSGNLNTFAGIWDRCYTLINRANNAINTMENVKSWSSESERNRLFGESYFLRAMAYYELAQVFGGAPLRTTLESSRKPWLLRLPIPEPHTGSTVMKAVGTYVTREEAEAVRAEMMKRPATPYQDSTL